jgi:hypothetical protein
VLNVTIKLLMGPMNMALSKKEKEKEVMSAPMN